MDSKKMSQIIRSISELSLEELFVAATGYEPSLTQVANVTAYIEEQYGLDTIVEQEVKVETAPAPVTVATPKVKRVYSKRKPERKVPNYLVNWNDPDVRLFLDIALDGTERTFQFAELNSIMPFSKVSFSVFTHYLRKTAKRRGFVTASFKRDFKSRTLTIKAVRTK